jgi:hypothetical protein
MKQQNKQNSKKEKPTLESLWAYLYESSEKFDRKFEKMQEEARKRSEEFDRELKESSKKFDEKLNKISEEIGGIGNSNGDVAEEYFINAFKMKPQLNGETFGAVMHNVRFAPDDIFNAEHRKEYNDEYDIFLLNNKSIAIIEIKYNAKIGNIKRLLEKAENFREYQPKYNKHKLYLGIAALSFRKVTEERILKEGIAVIKQVGDKMVIHDKNLKVF